MSGRRGKNVAPKGKQFTFHNRVCAINTQREKSMPTDLTTESLLSRASQTLTLGERSGQAANVASTCIKP